MNFAVALYGSFRDTNGYAWKLPYGYDQGQLERISALLEPPGDGRKLDNDDLHGGYYVDVSRDLFYAFRFIDGGRDALGRAGTVLTNCAIARYSDLIGMNLKALFHSLTFREMPPGGSVEIDLPHTFGFANDTASFTAVQLLYGEDAERVFQLPAARFPGNVLVRFTMNGKGKEACVKFLSAKMPRPQPPKKEPGPVGEPDNHIVRIFILRPLCFVVLVAVLCIAGIVLVKLWDYLQQENTVNPPPESISNEPFKVATRITVRRWNTVLPEDCSWKRNGDPKGFFKENSDAVTNKKNIYRWGELSICDSKIIITFAENVVLEKNDDKWNIKQADERLGTLQITNDGWLITFSQDTVKNRELSGGHHASRRGTDKKCAQLSIEAGSIQFKVDRTK